MAGYQTHVHTHFNRVGFHVQYVDQYPDEVAVAIAVTSGASVASIVSAADPVTVMRLSAVSHKAASSVCAWTVTGMVEAGSTTLTLAVADARRTVPSWWVFTSTPGNPTCSLDTTGSRSPAGVLGAFEPHAPPGTGTASDRPPTQPERP